MPGSYLVVELTNRCSLACVHCSVSEGKAHPHHRTSGYLDPLLFEALVDDLVAVGAGFDTSATGAEANESSQGWMLWTNLDCKKTLPQTTQKP